MNQPSAETAINILTKLQEQTSSAALAYWIAPNSVLTLSGARAMCDGVYYATSRYGNKQLSAWTKEIQDSIEILSSITAVYLSQFGIDKTSTTKEKYTRYDVIIAQGLDYVLNNTKLLGDGKLELISTGDKLIEAMSILLKQDSRFSHFKEENLYHIVYGIILGYPDKAILGSVAEWENDDPFAEPLIDADIRGSRFYACPIPVYSYPRHMINDSDINAHEQLWSKILKDFYASDFHKNLAKDKAFNQKAKELGILR